MNDFSRKLPIGIQTFEKIRTENYLYVDKTDLVYKLVSTSVPYFLSRPRRFGKSLLISTFEAYFEGRKELFEGLAIAKLETEWKQYPVLHLDLNAEKYDNTMSLEEILDDHLNIWEDTWGKEKREKTPSNRFKGIIRRAFKQTGMKVVVLIDEYDKPLLQNLLNKDLLDEMRMILKAFYGVLKSYDRYLRFVFLTGVTKFAQVSVFSDLNQLSDISLDMNYSTLCGITHEELLQVFAPEIKKVGEYNNLSIEETMKELTSRYNGYHFSENSSSVFNPFSLLNVFEKLRFDNYWFQTGTPTFLIKLLQDSNYDLRKLIDGVETYSSGFSEYRADANNPLPMLYQSGYLTIKNYNFRFQEYTLCFPNEEVKYAFIQFLLPYYTPINDSEKSFYITHFVREVERGDIPAFLTRMKAFFANIPYELNDQSERHYQVVFYLIFTLIGQFVQAEVHSAIGRADAVVKTDEAIYIFEFKLNGTAEEALQQINEKGYLNPYIVENKKLIKIGVEFDKATKNIGRYLVE